MTDLICCPLGQHPIMLAFFFGASAPATRTGLRTTLTRCRDQTSARSGGAGEEVVDGDPPFFEEPLGDVDTVPILLAPDAELARGGIRARREVQPPRLQLELGGEHGTGQDGTPSVRAAAFAHACRRQARSYSASVDFGVESLCGSRVSDSA